MTETIIETLVSVCFLALLAVIWLRRDSFDSTARRPLLAGFALLMLASLIAITDNFPALDRFIVIGDTPAAAFTKNLLGYLLGAALIVVALMRLAPIAEKLAAARHDLFESRERFQLAMQGACGGYWEWRDPNEQEGIWLSERFYSVLGYEPGEFDADISWFRDALHPDDRELVWSAVNAHLRFRTPFHAQYRMRTKSGDYRWFQARGQACWDDHGNPTRLSCSVVDITDRKHYQHAINHLTSGVAAYTGHSYLDNLVLQLHELFSVDYVLIAMLDESEGDQLHTVTRCVDGAIVDNISWNTVTSPSGEVIDSATACTFRSRVQEKFPADRQLQAENIESYIGIPLFAPDGGILGLMALMDRKSIRNDLFVIEIAQLFADRAVAEIERIQSESELIMHREHLEDLVVHRTEELRRSNKELESFSYSVSHDLRGPLRAIDGFSESLAEDYADQLDTTARDYLKRIRRNTDRMGQLIDDLLVLSRVTRHEINTSSVDLSQLCREVTDQFQSEHPDRQVDINIQAGIMARGDPSLLRIVLENLVSNAWKYTSKTASAVIEFSAAHGDGETVYQLSDNGAGFNMKYADKLFEVFQRLHGKQDFEGTGVGLATVSRVIDRHGGSIWAESEPGKGARFYFTLPESSTGPNRDF